MVALEDSDFVVLGDSIDLNQVSALPVADTVGYVKQATLLMIQHLNKFSIAADERLRLMSASISRLETELTILESKLASIPGLDSIKAPPPSSANTSEASAAEAVLVQPQPAQSINQSTPVAAQPSLPTGVAISPPVAPPTVSPIPVTPSMVETAAAATPEPTVLTVNKDPVYGKYFRMLQVGVPPQAVKLKMQSEGLDPALLDTPNAPSPSVNAAAAPKREEDASDDNDDTDSDDSD